MEEKFTTAGYREYSVYKYNSNGHQELRTLIGGNGKPVSQKQITFDLNGNELIYTTIFDHLNPDHNYTFIKEYDENNKLIREMVNSKNGELLSDTHYYFDEKNCLIRETTLFGNPEEGYSSNEIIYENKYDRKNNLIRQIRFTNGVPDKLTKWKIKYYFC